MKNKIHVVSFQNPYPPTYGGVIDVYYKLKSLKEAGFYVILHTYYYKTRGCNIGSLQPYVDEIYYYKRKTGWRSQLSLLPYIVNSRRDPQLLENLLKDDAPILFEGLHTCYWLNDARLARRYKIVRAHNIEHNYYDGLRKATHNLKEKLFYALEAFRLKRYERVLDHANAIAAISSEEFSYFESRYRNAKTILSPCFYDDAKPDGIPGSGNYVLYQGNLSVPENINAAAWIMDEIATSLPSIRFVFAGSNPAEILIAKAASLQNVEIVANPTDDEMHTWVRDARIHLLLTFQATGVKLKLLNALNQGAFVIANTPMLAGTGLEKLCIVADTTEELITAIEQTMKRQFALEDRDYSLLYSNSDSLAPIKELIQNR